MSITLDKRNPLSRHQCAEVWALTWPCIRNVVSAWPALGWDETEGRVPVRVRSLPVPSIYCLKVLEQGRIFKQPLSWGRRKFWGWMRTSMGGMSRLSSLGWRNSWVLQTNRNLPSSYFPIVSKVSEPVRRLTFTAEIEKKKSQLDPVVTFLLRHLRM